MARWPILPVLALLVGAPALAGPSPAAMMFNARGMVRLAWRAVQDDLVDQPADPDLLAQSGSVLCDMGDFADAIEFFEDSSGAGRFYQRMGGLRDHADALREVGRPLDAAALREEALASTPSKGRLALYQGLIADYRAAGDFAGGREAAWMGLAEFPNAANLHAALAELELAAGNRDLAEVHLHTSERLQPAGVFRAHLLRGRLALLDADYAAVRQHLATLRKRDLRDLEVLQLLLQLELAANGPEAALAVLELPAWGHQAHPAVGCLEALALFDAGERAEARAKVAALEARYPLRGDVKALRYVVDSF